MKNVYELYKEVAKKQGLFGTGISVNKFKKTLCCFEEGHRKAVEEYIEKMKDLGDNNYFIPMPSLYLSMAYNLNYVKGNKITRGCVYFAKKENIGAEILIKYAVDWTRKNATNLIECEWSTTLVAYELEEYELLEEKDQWLFV